MMNAQQKARGGVALSLLLALSLVSTGCKMGTGQTLGHLGGGAMGALIGSTIGDGSGKLVAVGVGAVLGSMLGGAVGSTFDQEDERRAGEATERALATQQVAVWENPRSGLRGRVEPGRTWVNHDNHRTYRRFTQLVYIGGQPREIHGVAYLGYDGRWHLASQDEINAHM